MNLILLLFIAVINAFFAIGLLLEARELKNQRILFAPMPVWLLATVIGGPLVVLAFWVIHFSNLKEKNLLRNNQDPTLQESVESLYSDGMLVHGSTLSDDRVVEYLNRK